VSPILTKEAASVAEAYFTFIFFFFIKSNKNIDIIVKSLNRLIVYKQI